MRAGGHGRSNDGPPMANSWVESLPMKIVAVTGWGQDYDKKRSLEAGFDEHLVKPVDESALLAL